MRVAHVAAEISPWCSTGGLGAVVAALPEAIAARNVHVDVYVPMCRAARLATAAGLAVDAAAEVDGAAVRTARVGSVDVHFIDAPGSFDRATLYGPHGDPYPDDPQRFAFLARGTIAAWEASDRPPDVVHVHDWHPALLPLYLGTADPPSVLTIHNLAHQGAFSAAQLGGLDLPGVGPDGGINFLAAGIAAADAVTTVSPTYATEILTPEHGHGLDELLRSRDRPPLGVRNGIDTATWDPATDPHLPEPFTGDAMAGKEGARAAVLAEAGLEDKGGLVAALVARLGWQKGTDLVTELGPVLADEGSQLVVVGEGDPTHVAALASMAELHPEHVAFINAWAPRTAHLAVAGADVMLIPSRFEPSGLTQMEAMRYGTLPIATATGGLVDTIGDAGSGDDATGFLFPGPSTPELARALRLAAELHRHDPERWATMRANAMGRDWGWSGPAARYVALYRELIAGS